MGGIVHLILLSVLRWPFFSKRLCLLKMSGDENTGSEQLHWAHGDCSAQYSNKEPVKSKAHISQDVNRTNFSTSLNNSKQQKNSLFISFVCSK